MDINRVLLDNKKGRRDLAYVHLNAKPTGDNNV